MMHGITNLNSQRMNIGIPIIAIICIVHVAGGLVTGDTGVTVAAIAVAVVVDVPGVRVQGAVFVDVPIAVVVDAIAELICVGMNSLVGVVAVRPHGDMARGLVAGALQGGDESLRHDWQKLIDVTMDAVQDASDRLGVTLGPEHNCGESTYRTELQGVIDHLQACSMAREDQGALVVDFPDRERPLLVRKSDGGFLYATTDLSAVRYRAGQVGAKRVLYIVDARQKLHLRQVFAVAQAAGYAPDSVALEHYPFGTMLGEDHKPFKTRTGGTVKLMELLQEAEDRAFALVGEKNPDLSADERRQIARVVGIGSVKYADLSLNRETDYVFSWDNMLSLDGNTAPYLQYSYARVKSLFRRAEIDEESLAAAIIVAEKAEKVLAAKLLQFGEAVEVVAREGYPNLLCNYLYELADAFMKFYENCPVLRADEPVRSSRLQLARLTARTIGKGLGLLGIETVERM